MLRQLFPAILLLGAALPAAAQTAPLPALDLMPLKKALAPLDGVQPITLRSTITMTGSKQGLSFTFREKVAITALRPKRFHAALTQIDAQGVPQKRLVVISDGTTVWTDQPSLRQYSVTSFRAFKAADSDIYTLGLIVGGFYLGDGYPLLQGFHSLTPANSADVLAALSKMDVTLSRHAETAANQDAYVYRMVLAKQNLAYQFYVNTETNKLTRIDLSGTDNGLQIGFREDVAQMTPQATIAKSTFQFIPPAGTTKAASVSVNPF